MRLFASPTHGRRVVTHAALLAVLVGLLSVGIHAAVPELADPQALRAAILSTGPLAPLVYVLLLAAQVVVAPVPGQALGFVGGYLFGPVWGTVYSLVGVTLGSVAVFVLARRFGRPYVERMLAPDLMARFDDFVAEAGVPGLFLVFLIPGLPDDAVCFLAGLTTVPLRRLTLLVVVGRAPAFALVSLAGSNAAAGDYETTLLLLGVGTGLALAGYLARDRIVRALNRL